MPLSPIVIPRRHPRERHSRNLFRSLDCHTSLVHLRMTALYLSFRDGLP